MNWTVVLEIVKAAGNVILLLPQLVQAVNAVITQSGVSQNEAILQVGAHLTPGMPNHPALSGPVTVSVTPAPGVPSASAASR